MKLIIRYSLSGVDQDGDGLEDYKRSEFRRKAVMMGGRSSVGSWFPIPDEVEETTIDDMRRRRMGHGVTGLVDVTFAPPAWG